MFYPLEVIFANKKIYFAGKKDLLCSYCCSLLEFYDPDKTEQRLEVPNFSILAGLNAIKYNQDVETALPKACAAILDTLDILQGIKPFAYLNRDHRADFSTNPIDEIVQNYGRICYTCIVKVNNRNKTKQTI